MWKRFFLFLFILCSQCCLSASAGTSVPGERYTSGTVAECKDGKFGFCGYNHNAEMHGTIAMFPGAASANLSNPQIMDRYLPFTQYLSKELNARLMLVPIEYGTPAFKSLKAGMYAFFYGPPIFAAKSLDKYEPLLRNDKGITAVVLVLSKSPYTSVTDFKAADKIGVPPAGLLQTVLAKGLLIEAGSKAKTESSAVISVSVLADKCRSNFVQGFVVSSQELKGFMEKNPGEFRVIAKSAEAPGFTLIARKDIDPRLKRMVVNGVLKLQSEKDLSEENVRIWKGLNASNFVAARQTDYNELVHAIAVAEAGVVLKPKAISQAVFIKEAKR
jgi:hypothetical protein